MTVELVIYESAASRYVSSMVQVVGVEKSIKRSTSKKKAMTNELITPSPYALRKEQKRSLMEQVERMQNELDKLKFRVLVKQGIMDKATRCTKAENSVLEDFIEKQQLTLATTKAALSGHVQRSVRTLQPLQRVIRLGSDQTERNEVVLSLKDEMIDYGARYLAARRHGLALQSYYYQEELVNTPDGDYCVVRFDAMPIYGAPLNVVFDTSVRALKNSEMHLSELYGGSVTIREDDDFGSTEFTQLRLVSLTSAGTTVESNSLEFSKLVEGGAYGDYGVLVQDFVDDDELYPYQSHERVRRDCTSVVMLQAIPGAEGPPAVSITRWTSFKIHHSTRAISKSPETELRESSICWSETAGNLMQQLLV